MIKNVILCSSNQILIKSLYGLLRDEGYTVEIIEHPAVAVHMVMLRRYDFIIIDSEPFGLPAEDAVEIIKTITPGVPVLFMGAGWDRKHSRVVETPLDLEEFKRTIHSITV